MLTINIKVTIVRKTIKLNPLYKKTFACQEPIISAPVHAYRVQFQRGKNLLPRLWAPVLTERYMAAVRNMQLKQQIGWSL